MDEGKTSIEDALIQIIKDGKGSITGLKELANEYNITLEQLTGSIKKLSEKNMIKILETKEGDVKLFIREKEN
jgi:DNA-binding MarR family transcriptional regulator